jgi:peptide/nickel transport system substrate-binding protein
MVCFAGRERSDTLTTRRQSRERKGDVVVNLFSRRRLALGAAAAVSIGLAACGGGNATSAGGGSAGGSSSGGSGGNRTAMTISRQNDPSSFDPAQSVATGSGLETLTAFYDRLIDLTPKGQLEPSLAASWKMSPDGLTYTLQLRKGVTFHDGSRFDATQVRYTWQRIVALKAPAAQYWTNVADVKAAGPYTVVFRLKKPQPTFLPTLAGQRGIYMGPSQQCVKAHASGSDKWAKNYFTDHECGTGPYVLGSWQHDQQITFSAYPKYWRGWSGNHVKRYVQKIIKEPSTVQLLLTQGGLDLAADVLPTQIDQQLQKSSSVKLDVAPTTTLDQITFNMDRKPTSDPRVRKAIAMLFDYNAAITQAYAGKAKRVYGPIPSTIWPPIPASAARYDTNVAQAKRLLAQAGYPHGFKLQFRTTDLNQWKNIALILQSSLSAANIDVQTTFTTWPVLFAGLSKPKGQKPFDMAGYQMWAAIPDPSDILMWWDTSAITVINPGWGNATTDSWIQRAGTDMNRAQRVQLYDKVITQLNTDAPAIWVDQPNNVQAMRKNVEGFQYNPYYNGLLDFYALSKS